METREDLSSGVTVIGAEAPSTYLVAPRSETPSQIAGSPAVGVPPVGVGSAGTIEKKKRGRPRKYGPDGTPARPLSPMPISSSAPPSGEFSAGKANKLWPSSSEKKKKKHKKMGMENLGIPVLET